MNVNNKHYRTIWAAEDGDAIELIDQRWLPHRFETERLTKPSEIVTAISEMHIRGAGAIGAAAGFGMYLAVATSDDSTVDQNVQRAATALKASRPTAVNLEWAVDRLLRALEKGNTQSEKRRIALQEAQRIADEDAEACRRIGEHGLEIIRIISDEKKNGCVHILTHCNAGWLAFVDYGTATAPIYAAHDAGIEVHVWVDETRPRNQGARLTAWELEQHGVPHTIIADNTGGHLMQNGKVDLVMVGTDRTSVTGFVTNKIGTYLKALAAKDNDIPFYVALPSSSMDWASRGAMEDAPIEERPGDEVKYAQGLIDGEIRSVLLTPKNSVAVNYAFDITPPRLITALITERGVMQPNEEAILECYPEQRESGQKND
ncbi:MAG: S-methyl-5-thioribose-1-phosphate isomerase [Bacteroidetes bacterium]|nr:MAG: S-methyl-5-thioribose-1-phosphate isomerase [Bacteroidota bacterium]